MNMTSLTGKKVSKSVNSSIFDSVWDSVWDSVRRSAYNAVCDSVCVLVRGDVINSTDSAVLDSVTRTIESKLQEYDFSKRES